MGIKNNVIQFVEKILHPNRYNSEAYANYLRRNGAEIGENTFFFAPKSTVIDERRLSYIKIGNGCAITSGVQLLCHDYSWSVLRKSHNEILPDPGRPITIGNNVFIGWNSIIIGSVDIGSNVIIGAHSVVTKDVPDNVVVAGNPARVICTLDEYYQKKKSQELENAKKRALHVFKTTGKKPTINEMGWFNTLWMERNRENEQYLRTLPFRNDNIDEVIGTFYSTKPLFNSLDAFWNEIINDGKNVKNEHL